MGTVEQIQPDSMTFSMSLLPSAVFPTKSFRFLGLHRIAPCRLSRQVPSFSGEEVESGGDREAQRHQGNDRKQRFNGSIMANQRQKSNSTITNY